ncbi:ABC transporter substrate-binding protein [Halobacterium sp. CBA1126]|uniref:ABC transporter substrate-binding protein n=1 Tax=Halobacterium sp. CBA1126 TaxID=2668074 RepID=UPI0018D226E3|nr:PhnD/SsuA/transferrin family substrate-binding protein [Halobacterium sp. CBA1126]
MTQRSTNRRTFLKSGTAAAAVGLTGITGCLGGGGGGGVSDLGLAFTVPVENLGSLFDIPELREELTNVGEEYELSVTRNESTPDSLNAMAAGDVDMALLTTVSYGSAVSQEAVPGNISMISTDFWDAHPEWYGFTIFAGPDTGITEPADLEGANIGVNAQGTGTHAVISKALRSADIDPEDGAEIVELPFPSIASGINDGRLDAAIFPALFAVARAPKGSPKSSPARTSGTRRTRSRTRSPRTTPWTTSPTPSSCSARTSLSSSSTATRTARRSSRWRPSTSNCRRTSSTGSS